MRHYDSTNLHIYFFCCFTSFTFFSNYVISVDTLTGNQSLRINQTLISPKEVFEFGFFSPQSSNTSRWYLGIWYKDIPDKTVVWVANRDTPLENSNGSLKLGENGNLVLLDQAGNSIWFSNQTTAKNPVLQLLDNGNLILREANDAVNYVWQSFDYPTDTLLPGMKLGLNLKTGMEYSLTSWKSQVDPSSGNFSIRMEYHGGSLPEFFQWNKQVKVYRSGTWNGRVFTSLPNVFLQDSLSVDATGEYLIISLVNHSKYTRLTINSTGESQRLVWVESSQSWDKIWYGPSKDGCDKYPRCGPYGICDANTFPVCNCIQGFNGKNQMEWDLGNASSGCARNTALDCGNDEFRRLQNVGLPEMTKVFVDKSMALVECKDMCLNNCSCTAYANVEVTNGGTGCVMWIDELSDTRQFSDGGGQDLYVRLAASDVDDGDTQSAGSSNKKSNVSKVVGITLGAAVVILVVSLLILWKKRKLHGIWKWKAQQKGAFEGNQHLELNFN